LGGEFARRFTSPDEGFIAACVFRHDPSCAAPKGDMAAANNSVIPMNNADHVSSANPQGGRHRPRLRHTSGNVLR